MHFSHTPGVAGENGEEYVSPCDGHGCPCSNGFIKYKAGDGVERSRIMPFRDVKTKEGHDHRVWNDGSIHCASHGGLVCTSCGRHVSMTTDARCQICAIKRSEAKKGKR